MNNAFRWNDWNEDHISQHGIRPQEAEYVVDNAARPYPENIGYGKWLVRGQAPDGHYIQVIFVIEDDCYYVIHARGLTEIEKAQAAQETPMIKKQKRWSEMNTEELAAATKEFDDPNYDPPVRKPTKRQLSQLDRVQRKSAANRFRIALLLEKKLVEQTDDYAVNHGITFSEVVADALRRLMNKKSA